MFKHYPIHCCRRECIGRCVYLCMYLFVCMYMYVYAHVPVCIHVCMYMSVCMCLYLCHCMCWTINILELKINIIGICSPISHIMSEVDIKQTQIFEMRSVRISKSDMSSQDMLYNFTGAFLPGYINDLLAITI